MKIGIITDLHYGVRNDSLTFLDYQKKSNDFYFQEFDSRGVKNLICLGDLYDRRKYLNYVTAYRCKTDFLDRVESKYDMNIILGNHDIYHKNKHDVNALENQCAEYKNIHKYGVASEVHYGDTSILLVPWICESNKDEAYSAIETSEAQIVMGHFELNGFEMDRGNIHYGGDDASMFARFDMVLSGHFHHRSRKKNITYIGAAYEFTWADWNDPKGITIFDTETRQLEFVKNPHTMFNMLAYDDMNNAQVLESDLDGDFSKYKDTYIKIVVVKKSNPDLFDRFMNRIIKSEPQDITVVEDLAPFVDDVQDDIVNQAEDTMSILNKYVDGLQMTVNPDKLKSIMKQIYMESIAIKETQDA